MAHNVLQADLERQLKTFTKHAFPEAKSCFHNAANTLLNGLVAGGSTLVTRLAAFLEENKTEAKGRCERVSGWLERHDFATPAAEWLAAQNIPRVKDGTTLAVDLCDLSKPFGGKGMEGMARGRDASRKTLAMGHTFGAAVAVAPSRQSVHPLRFAFEKGRKGENERVEDPVRFIHQAAKGRGIFALDRGSDSERALTFLQNLGCRAVVRVKELQRDVFGTGAKIDVQLDAQPRTTARLFKSNGHLAAQLSWRVGRLGELHDTPVLMVRSAFDGHTLYLYYIPGQQERETNALEKHPARLALAAAQAYLDRWQIETFFLRVKQDFQLEGARVRTFKRLKNLFYLCVLGYSFCADVLPASPSHTRMLKMFKDNFQRVTFRLQTFLSGLRTLLEQPRLNFISGRPRKRVFTPPFQLVMNL
jgi:hypothetical protein